MTDGKTPTDFDLKFPIGKSPVTLSYDQARVQTAIESIASLPEKLATLVNGVDRKKLGNAYRDGGWTATQVIHHIADSHINSFCRFKLALTEDNPTIRPYQEDQWARLPDYSLELVDVSLRLIESLHVKWTALLQAMSESDWHRTFYHPENQKTTPLYHNVAVYSWHGNHHLKHVEIAIGK